MQKLVHITTDGWVCFFCPACACGHGVPLSDPRWTWNKSYDKPSIAPSIRVDGCHVTLTEGVLFFHNDCQHALRGKQVPLEDF